jgi:hypothetical protein
VVRTKARGVPCIRISTIATAARLGMIKVHIVPVMIRLTETIVTQNTRFIRLTRPTHPHNIILAKGMLTDPAGDCFPEGLESHQGVFGGAVGFGGKDSRQEAGAVGAFHQRGFFLFQTRERVECFLEGLAAAHEKGSCVGVGVGIGIGCGV